MAKKLTKAQERKVELQEQEIKNQDKIIDGLLKARDFGVELTGIQEKILDKALKERTIKEETTSLEKTLTKQSLSTNKIKSERNKQAAIQLANLKKSFKTTDMTEESFKSQSALISQIAAGTASIEEIQSAIADLPADAADGMKEYLETSKQTLETQQLQKDALSEADGIIGGMGTKIVKFITNPLTAAVAALLMFNATQESIGKQFGVIGTSTDHFRREIAGAQTQFAQLGLSAEDANTTISELSSGFGLSVDESAKLSENVSRLAVSTGASVQDTAKLVGLFTQTQDLTGEQASNLLQSAQFLAKANNVAPDKILSDVAQSTEFFAKFADEGGENILRAAVQARKLGINLQAVEKITGGLLEFQTSLNAENEASVLIGRKLNFQKARELALANDIEGATAAVVEQLGSAEEFNKLNAIQRKALADAAGVEVGELQKIVNKEKEALTLQGALSKTEIKPIPEEVLTNTAKLIGSLQSIGITLAEVLGPPLNMVVGAFAFMGEGLNLVNEFIQKNIEVMTVLGGAYGAFMVYQKAKMLMDKKETIGLIAKKAFQGMMGGPLSIGLGIAAMLAGIAAVNRIFTMDDGVIGPGGETMVSGPKGSIKLNDQDSMIVGTNLMGGSGGGTDTSALESKQNETNSKLERVAAVLEGALSGPKPALARAMGGVVGDSIDGMA